MTKFIFHPPPQRHGHRTYIGLISDLYRSYIGVNIYYALIDSVLQMLKLS